MNLSILLDLVSRIALLLLQAGPNSAQYGVYSGIL